MKRVKTKKKNTAKKGVKHMYLIYGFLVLFAAFGILASFFKPIPIKLTPPQPVVESPSSKKLDYWLIISDEFPTYQPAWIELSKIYLSKKQYSKAETAFRKAQSLDPNSQELASIRTQLYGR